MLNPKATTYFGGHPVRALSDDAAFRSVLSNSSAILELGTVKLQERDPEACELFASVAHAHDVREAWLGLAAAHYQRAETVLAGNALASALSHHAIADMPPFAASIAALLKVPGWCALDGAGRLTVRLVQALATRSRLVAHLDGNALTLNPDPNGQTFTTRLPSGWRRAREIEVSVGKVALLGSPISLRCIVRAEGFVDSRNGDLHGWVWCPNSPDTDPELAIEPLDGRRGITVVASDCTIDVVSRTPLARPRGFNIPADQLRRFGGPVRVCGPDGRNLTGSPLDPFAERHNAEAASRIIAGLFIPPGRPTRAVLTGLLFPSAPADVRGGPVVGGHKKRPVDVIVPVYGGLDLARACLDSVRTNLPRWARILVIDDASPDPRVGRELAKFAARRRITLLTNAQNRGFPGTVNRGMCHDAARDVVLLNSDTLVAPGWLESLREAAYSEPDIGSATPLSNDATILSYPSVEHSNAIPDFSETVRLNALAQRANAGRLVDIPTAVGFCVYIKRDCLNATGLFREDVFAQGYGEENDFCIRARHLGWRHVAVPGVFVAHVGGQSFGDTKRHLIERNMRRLNQLHPGYDALIQEFQRVDPMAEPRRRLDMERWKTFRTRVRSVLLITQGRGGGIERHVKERAAVLRGEGFRPIVLWPKASREDGGRDCVLGDGPEGGTPNLSFSMPAELDALVRVLRADRPVRAEVHSMIGHDHRLMQLFQRLHIPYDIIVHDYSWMCPRINLVGLTRRYCGEPDLVECERCTMTAGPLNDEVISLRALRGRSAIEIAGASDVVVPSDDVAVRMRRHFPSVRSKVVNWEDDSLLPPPDPSPPTPDGMRRVCVAGAIGIGKGFDILLACAQDVSNRNLNLRFHLVGYSCDDSRLEATGRVHITGRYEDAEAVPLIRQQRAQLAWLPSLWPETWCYALTQTWRAGLNVLAFDIGTPAQRIRHTGRGWVYPMGLAPQAINDVLLALPPVIAGTVTSVTTAQTNDAVTLRRNQTSLWLGPM